jgi:hypothetical protein
LFYLLAVPKDEEGGALTNQPIIMKEDPPAADIPTHPYFFYCKCGAILGKLRTIDGALYLCVYRRSFHEPPICMPRANVRMLSGDVHCTCCGRWEPFNAAAVGP